MRVICRPKNEREVTKLHYICSDNKFTITKWHTKYKFTMQVAHNKWNSRCHFKVKRSKVHVSKPYKAHTRNALAVTDKQDGYILGGPVAATK